MSAGSRFDLPVLETTPRVPGKPRHKTREVVVGGLPIGGDSPIRVQSMTTTDTFDVEGTVAQIAGFDPFADRVLGHQCDQARLAIDLGAEHHHARAKLVAQPCGKRAQVVELLLPGGADHDWRPEQLRDARRRQLALSDRRVLRPDGQL